MKIKITKEQLIAAISEIPDEQPIEFEGFGEKREIDPSVMGFRQFELGDRQINIYLPAKPNGVVSAFASNIR